MNVTPSGSRDSDQPTVVRYRWVGPGVDQRLTVFEDGLVELDERRRTRESAWLSIDSGDIAELRAALEKVPRESWSRAPKLNLLRAGDWLEELFSFYDDFARGWYFQMKRGRRAISGRVEPITDLMAVAFLDALRSNAFHLAESLNPTR